MMAHGSRLGAMVQHPTCLFAYWEIEEADLAAVERALNARRESLSLALRVYRLGDGGPEGVSYVTMPVDLSMGRYYVNDVEPGGLYWLEVGVQTEGQGFLRLLRSNIVETPPAAVSPGDSRAEAGGVAYSPLAACG